MQSIYRAGKIVLIIIQITEWQKYKMPNQAPFINIKYFIIAQI